MGWEPYWLINSRLTACLFSFNLGIMTRDLVKLQHRVEATIGKSCEIEIWASFEHFSLLNMHVKKVLKKKKTFPAHRYGSSMLMCLSLPAVENKFWFFVGASKKGKRISVKNLRLC